MSELYTACAPNFHHTQGQLVSRKQAIVGDLIGQCVLGVKLSREGETKRQRGLLELQDRKYCAFDSYEVISLLFCASSLYWRTFSI